MKLWLDDERDPTDLAIQQLFGSTSDMVWVKTAAEAIDKLKTNKVAFISLDHDLGEGNGSGNDVANWIERNAFYGKVPRLTWAIHSMNNVGGPYMKMALINADQYWTANE